MKMLITNKYNLKEEQMTEVVKRIKVLIINSKKEVLLGYSHNDYQFPGGHVEDGETLIETVNREILEETGINLNIKDIKPFACALGYYKDWPAKNKNRKTEIYYFEVKTDERPNLENTKYTDNEKSGNFELRYIPLENICKELSENAKTFKDNKGITKEMLEIFNLYKEMTNN